MLVTFELPEILRERLARVAGVLGIPQGRFLVQLLAQGLPDYEATLGLAGAAPDCPACNEPPGMHLTGCVFAPGLVE